MKILPPDEKYFFYYSDIVLEVIMEEIVEQLDRE